MKVKMCVVATFFLTLTACGQQRPVHANDTDSKPSAGIQIKDAPAAVEKTVIEQSASATLVGFTTEKEKN
jgi:predicted small lipoprotein YifL